MRGLTELEYDLLLERLHGRAPENIVYEGDPRFDAIGVMVERGLIEEREEMHTDGEPLMVGYVTALGRVAVRCEEAVRFGMAPRERKAT